MPNARLLLHGTDGERTVELVPPGPLTIGRDPSRSIRLEDKQVSRLHADLRWEAETAALPGHWRIRDCGSTGGTWVNDARLPPSEEGVALRHGDRIRIVPWTLELSDPSMVTGDHTLMGESGREDDGGSLERIELTPQKAFEHRQLLALREAMDEFFACRDEQETQRRLVEIAAGLTQSDAVAFVASEGDGSNPHILAAIGTVREPSGRLRVSRRMLRAAGDGVPVAWDGGTDMSATLGASLEQVGVDRAICVPVQLGGEHFGSLWLGDSMVKDRAQQKELTSVAHSLAKIAAGRLRDLASTRAMVELAVNTLEGRDTYTGGHSRRVAAFAELLAGRAGLDDAMQLLVSRCGRVHDYGKITVDDQVLRKPGRLTEEEFGQIQAHARRGHELLRQHPQMQDVLPGVLEHHEKWDGTGYPDRKRGDTISLLGRIICIADCFDAMTSARPYRAAIPLDKVLGIIEQDSGSHFDPELVQAFLKIPRDALLAHIQRPEERGQVAGG